MQLRFFLILIYYFKLNIKELKNILQNLNREFIQEDAENFNIIQKMNNLEQIINEYSNNNQLFTKVSKKILFFFKQVINFKVL